MDLLLSNREAKGFARTLGSVPSLLPIGKRYFDELDVGIVYVSKYQGQTPQNVDYITFINDIGCSVFDTT